MYVAGGETFVPVLEDIGRTDGATDRGVAGATSGGVGLYKTRSAEGGD